MPRQSCSATQRLSGSHTFKSVLSTVTFCCKSTRHLHNFTRVLTFLKVCQAQLAATGLELSECREKVKMSLVVAQRAAAGEAAVRERVAVGMGVGEALLGQVEEVCEHVEVMVLEMAAMAAESAAARERERRRAGERERERAVGEERAAERERARREAREQECGRVRALLSELEEVAVGVDNVRREVGGDAEVWDGLQKRLEALFREKCEWKDSLSVRSEEVVGLREEVFNLRGQLEREREMVARLKTAAEEREEGWRVEVEGLVERVEAAQEKLMSEKLLNDTLGKQLALLLSAHDKEKQRYVCVVCVCVCVCVCLCVCVCVCVCYTCMYMYIGPQDSARTPPSMRMCVRMCIRISCRRTMSW